jgi:RNase P/RNase MRP subunit p30
MIELLNPDVIGRGSVRMFWRQAEVLLQTAHRLGYFHGKTYYNQLHDDLMNGKEREMRFNECVQQARILETYRLISIQYTGRQDYRDAICSYLLSLIVIIPTS